MELNDRTKSEHDSQVREVTHVNGTGTYQDSALKVSRRSALILRD